MQLKTKMISGVAAVGAAALAGGLFVVAPGVGAVFEDSAQANASIDVGTLNCRFTNPNSSSNVSLSPHGSTANITLDTIKSSAAGSQDREVALKNHGSIPLLATWTVTTSGDLTSKFTPNSAPADIVLQPGDTETLNGGFSWTELDSDDMGTSGTVSYHVDCTEVTAANQAGFDLFGQEGGTATFDGTKVTLTIPDASGPDGAGFSVISPTPSLPVSAPGLTASPSPSAGTPRWVLKLTSGKSIFWYANGTSQTWNNGWQWHGASFGWSGIQSYAGSDVVTAAEVVADTSNGAVTTTVSCAQYDGTTLFGSGC